MAQTRFDFLSDQFSHRALANSNRDHLSRILWSRLMGLYGSLTYAPIWTGEPLRLEGWRTARFYCPLMPELDVLFPRMQLGRMAGQELTGERLAECLHEALWACAEERSKSARPHRRYAPNLRPLAHWQTSVQFQRKNVIEQMVQFASNDFTGLASLLLQGSLADGGVVEGYSDCDVIAILRLPQSKEAFVQQVSSVFQINDFLLAYQPLMHHGPMIYFQEALGWATESTLPSAILANSVLLVGQAPEVEYVNGDLEAGHAIRVFERFFERNFLRAAQLETAFDALWWISCTSLVPCLEYQLQERVSVWKRDLLTNIDHPFLNKTTQARLSLGHWMNSRLADDNWPVRGVLNPGLCLRQHKQTMKLTAAERESMGLNEGLLEEGRRYMCLASAELFESNHRQLFGAEPVLFGGWPYEVVDRPKTMGLKEYDQLRDEWKERAMASGKVEAIYEYGSVECPGLSDLDLLFVLRDGMGKEFFSILRLPERQQYLMGHDPQILPLDAVEDFSTIYPMMAVRRLVGRELPLRDASSMPKNTVAVAITAYNCRKYPGDLFTLADCQQTDFRTILAFLHSFTHVRQALLLLGCRVPASVELCIARDQELRKEFLIEGNLLSGELGPAMRLMLDASAGLLFELEQYWLRRIPWLGEVLPVSSTAEIAARITAAKESRDFGSVGLSGILDVICSYLSDASSAPWIESQRVTELLGVLSNYRKHKRSYLDKMQRAGLLADTYIADPQHLTDARTIGQRYFFEISCAGEQAGRGAIPTPEWGDQWSFRVGGQGNNLCVAGWSIAEDWGSWTCGKQALLLMRLPGNFPCQLTFDGYGFVTENHRSQRIRMLANGHRVADWLFTMGAPMPRLMIRIPQEMLLGGGELLLTIECPDARSPMALGLSDDARLLGLAVRSVCAQRMAWQTA